MTGMTAAGAVELTADDVHAAADIDLHFALDSWHGVMAQAEDRDLHFS